MTDELTQDETGTGMELVLVDTSKLAEVISGMGEVDLTPTSAQETRYRIVSEMLAATSEDELWAELPTWSSKEAVGKTFEIRDVRGVFESRFPDPETGAKGGFLACTAVDVETGELGVLTTSALRIAGRIGWYHQHQELPVTLEIYEKGQTAAGFSILDAKKAS